MSSDEQVKGIPEDLREHYEECGKYQNAHLILCRQLIERIARSEQALAKIRQPKLYTGQFYATVEVPDTCPDCDGRSFVSHGPNAMICYTCSLLQANDELEQALAALEARNRELESALRGIESLCADEITTRFGGHSHKSEDELGRNSRVYSLLVVPRNMARAALKGAS